MSKHLNIVMFPEVFIQLNNECLNHPELAKILSAKPTKLLENRIAEICTYCGIVVDGMYTQEDLEKLAGILIQKLRDKRAAIITIQ